MSLHGKIDLTRPLTEDEKEWLVTRPGGKSSIAVNDRQFGHLSDEERSALQVSHAEDVEDEADRLRAYLQEEDEDGEGFDPEDVGKVAPLTVTELRAWLKKKGQDQTGSKEELQIRMLEKMEADREGQ